MRTWILVCLALLTLAATAGAQNAVPPAPTNLKAELVPSLVPAVVRLSWESTRGPWGFRVYRSAADTLHFKPVALVNGTVYYDNLQEPRGLFFWYVTAVGFSTADTHLVESPRSNIVKMEFGTLPPPLKGVIAGTVKDDSTGTPIPGVMIKFVSNRPYMRPMDPYVVTDRNGQYKALLDTGTYYVRAEPPPYMPPGPPAYQGEWFDNVLELKEAKPILVEQNKSFVADFGLRRLLPPVRPKGTIAGTVVDDSTGKPIARVVIRFYCKNVSVNCVPSAMTDSLGFYSALLDTGTYLVRAEGPMLSTAAKPPYRSEWFDNVTDPLKATPVRVLAGVSFKANFGLSRMVMPVPATVEGLVTDTLGAPLRRATVVIMRSPKDMYLNAARAGEFAGPPEENVYVDGIGFCRGLLWRGMTDSLGRYRATVLTGASYIAMASKWGYLPEYYDNKRDPLQADVFEVKGNLSGIDFSLSVNPILQNSISGVVRDSLGKGVPSRIVLFPARPWLQPHMQVGRFAHTDENGAYTVTEVLTGKYFVLAVPYGEYAPAFYKAGAYGVLRWKDADTVVANGHVSGIDIGVVPVTPVGPVQVSGRVTASNGQPLDGVRVFALNGLAVAGVGVTDAGGFYAIEGLPTGPLAVVFDRDGYNPAQAGVTVAAGSFSAVNVNATLTLVATSAGGTAPLPASYELQQNYPNPFNPSTTIRFEMRDAGFVTLKVYNLLGQEMVTLVNGPAAAGTSTVVWNGRDALGRPSASGLYLYELTVHGKSGAREFQQARKMVLVK